MKFEKGDEKPKKSGRKKGVPNKSNARARAAIVKFVEGNVDRLNGWLDKIAAKDPEKAFQAFMSVIEYHIPKLARTELTGKDGKDIDYSNVTISIVRPKD